MKQLFVGLLVLSTLATHAQKKSSSKAKTSTIKKSDTSAVIETPIMVEAEVMEVVEEERAGSIQMAPVEESSRTTVNLDGNEPYYVYQNYRDRNLMIAYKGNDYDNRRYALLEFFTRKKITPFIFESMSGSFYDGEYSQVRLNGKYGVIDLKGKMLIPCIYDDMSKLSVDGQSYFIVSKNSRHGIINDQNEVVVPFEYQSIGKPYYSDIQLTVTKGNKMGLMNFVSRKMTIPAIYERVEVLGSSASSLVKVKNGKDYNLFNITGEQVFTNWYQRLDVNEDQTVTVEQKGKKALISLAEKKITPFDYESMERAYNSGKSTYIVQKAGKYGIIGSDGSVIVPLQYDQLTNSRSGMFLVAKGNKKGIIAVDGKIILPVEYEDLTHNDRYFVVKKNGKTGIANRDGQLVVPVEFESLTNTNIANDYNSTVFVGTRNGKKGMIDVMTGKTHLDFVYEDIIGTRTASYGGTEYFNSTIIAVKNGKYGMVELNGNVVVPFEYEDLQYVNSFAVIAKKNGKYGMREIYSNSALLLPYEYQFVNFKGTTVIAYKDAYEKYRLTGNKITREE